MSEVDEKLVERVADAITHAIVQQNGPAAARAAIAAMRKAGWLAPHQVEAGLMVVRDERDREKARADYAESALKERDNTIACQDRRYGDLERELHEQRKRAERAEAEVERLNGACTSYAKQSNHDVGTILRLKRELRELKERHAEPWSDVASMHAQDLHDLDVRLAALEQSILASEERPAEKPEGLDYHEKRINKLEVDALYTQERLTALERRLGSLNYEGVLSSFQQLMDRVAKLEQPQPPSAPAEEPVKITLSERDSRRVAEMLSEEPKPNAAFERAQKRYNDAIADGSLQVEQPSIDAAVLMDALAEHEIHWPDSRMCQDMLRAADLIARHAGLHVYDTEDALVDAAIEEGWDKGYARGKDEARAGLHVWSGDVEGLKSEIRSMKIAYPYNLSLDKILRKYGLIQAPAGDAGEGEQS